MVMLYAWQDEPSGITAFSDSDWAGCRDTRKSSSGAVFLNGKHYLRSYAKTQANIALSTAEAELYAIVTAASEGLGMKAMARDFGREANPHLHVDASAAIGITQRKGLGKLRHLDTQSLWIQDAVRTKRVGVEKVPGTENVADIGTKHLDGPTLDKLLKKLGIEFREGRAHSAPGLVHKTQSETKEDQGSAKNNEPNINDSKTTAHPAAPAPCNDSTKATLATDAPASIPPVPATHAGGKRNRVRQKKRQKKNGFDSVDFNDIVAHLCPCCEQGG